MHRFLDPPQTWVDETHRQRLLLLAAGLTTVLLIAFGGRFALADDPIREAVVDRSNDSSQDRMIALAVENELFSNDAVDGDAIDVTAEQGVVTISGKVNSLQAKRHATRAAKLIRGVRTVVNQMLVRPSLRDDQLLTLDAERALTQDPATEAHECLVVVEDGVARLAGVVDSLAERRLTEEVVSGVAGILAIDNRITVNPPSERPDSELIAEIRALLMASARLSDDDIVVTVQDGAVSLEGTVGSALAVDTAIELASVIGVREIDHSKLKIDASARDGVRRRQRYLALTDAQIEESVRLGLRHDPRVMSFAKKIDVDCHQGVVTLRGKISYLSTKSAAQAVAANTLGVDRVRNRLTFHMDVDRLDDTTIANNVRSALRRNAYLEQSDILVRSRRAHVDLFGIVNTRFEKDIAGWTAELQKGVAHVNNNLTVQSNIVTRSDAEILEAINEKLKWTFLDRADDIDVTVENGVAILRGTVDTRRQWQRVMQIAVDAGARAPHNLLEIRLLPQPGGTSVYVPSPSEESTETTQVR